MCSHPHTATPERKRIRPAWLGVLVALWVCTGAGDGRAAALSVAQSETPAARKHKCKCAVDCDGRCCCVGREKAKAGAPTQDTAIPAAGRKAGPCLHSLPCDGDGSPTASPQVPIGKFADRAAWADIFFRGPGALLSQSPCALYTSCAVSRLEDPPDEADPLV